MKDLIFYLIIFLLVYLFYVIFVLCRKNVLKNFPNGKEIKYLKMKYGIKVNDNNLILEILVGIITLIFLMLGVYHLIGIYYKKKQGGK